MLLIIAEGVVLEYSEQKGYVHIMMNVVLLCIDTAQKCYIQLNFCIDRIGQPGDGTLPVKPLIADCQMAHYQ